MGLIKAGAVKQIILRLCLKKPKLKNNAYQKQKSNIPFIRILLIV